MNKTIFGDESGNTGTDLLNEEQPFFCYCTVAIEEDEAKEIIQSLRARFNFQNKEELKGVDLSKRKDAFKIIDELFLKIGNRFKLSVINKKYAICCKLFEYVFEPVFADYNSIFYFHSFHLYLADFFFQSLERDDPYADDVFKDFYNLLKLKEESELTILFKKKSVKGATSPIKEILKFAHHHRNTIISEIKSIPNYLDSGVSNFQFELSVTSIQSLLAQWNTMYPEYELHFIHDDLDVLNSKYAQEMFSAMSKTGDKIINLKINGEDKRINFNLSDSPKSVSSKQYCGIQIADLLVSFYSYSINHSEIPDYTKILDLYNSKKEESMIYLNPVAESSPNLFSLFNKIIFHEIYKHLDKDISPQLIADFWYKKMHEYIADFISTSTIT